MDTTHGDRPKELKERNQSLVADYLEKTSDGVYIFSTTDILTKYKISYGRLYQLLKKAGVKRT